MSGLQGLSLWWLCGDLEQQDGTPNHVTHFNMHMLSNKGRLWEKSHKRQRMLQTFIIPTSPHPRVQTWREGYRSWTYTEAALGLLFLYRLGTDKIDALFPRDKGSSEKLKMKDNMLEVNICLIMSQFQKGALEHFYNGKHFYKWIPARMRDLPKLWVMCQINCQRHIMMYDSCINLTLYILGKPHKTGWGGGAEE